MRLTIAKKAQELCSMPARCFSTLCLFLLIMFPIPGCAPWVELGESNVRGTEFNSITYEGYENIEFIDHSIRDIFSKHLPDLDLFLRASGFACKKDLCSKILYNKMTNHNPYETSTPINISVLVTVRFSGSTGYTLSISHAD